MSDEAIKTAFADYERAFESLSKAYTKRLAGEGLKLGAVVKNREGVFRITRLGFLERPMLFGVKQRTAGDFACVETCISAVSGIEIVGGA